MARNHRDFGLQVLAVGLRPRPGPGGCSPADDGCRCDPQLATPGLCQLTPLSVPRRPWLPELGRPALARWPQVGPILPYQPPADALRVPMRQDRKSVVWGKSVDVRVDLGGRRNI